MAQVSIIQYAEITTGTGRPIRLGSKDVPSTIALTGTGEVVHRVYNDNANWPLNLFDADIITGALKFVAIKSSVDATLGFAATVGGGNNSTVPVEANVWCFIHGGTVPGYAANIDTRLAEALVDVAYISLYASANADVEVLFAY